MNEFKKVDTPVDNSSVNTKVDSNSSNGSNTADFSYESVSDNSVSNGGPTFFV